MEEAFAASFFPLDRGFLLDGVVRLVGLSSEVGFSWHGRVSGFLCIVTGTIVVL